MATIRILKFEGMLPAVDDRLLPDNAAAFAKNAWLYDGALRGFKAQRLVHTLDEPTACSVFRLPKGSPDFASIEDSVWMEFESAFVDVIRTAVSGDKYERYYWAQQTAAPRYNTRKRIEDGDPSFLLGVPAPDFTLTVTPDVPSSEELMETRSYVVTWVTEYGEEGPPCDPVTESGYSGKPWKVSGMIAPTDPERNITKQRIYRTVTSSQGVATYFFVAELGVEATEYTDAVTPTEITANNQLQSASWFPPPEDLEGWVAMPNGILAGWREKEIWFSEQYRPHAWPPSYTLVTEYEIVGLGVVGQTLVVCTTGFPTAVTGINPGSMTMAKLSTFEPCTSRGSIVSTPEGVYYTSPNGLIRATNGAFTNITKEFITKDKWQNLLRLQSLHAARLGTGYYVYGVGAWGAFDLNSFATGVFNEDDFAGSHSGMLLDPSRPNAITTLCSDDPVLNVINDTWSGELMMIRDGGVYVVDVQTENAVMQPYIWRSKVFQSNYPQNFEAMKVYFSGSLPDPLPDPPVDCFTIGEESLGEMRLYANGSLVLTRELVTSGTQWRLPSGFKADFWQIEFEARVTIYSVQMATAAKELRGV